MFGIDDAIITGLSVLLFGVISKYIHEKLKNSNCNCKGRLNDVNFNISFRKKNNDDKNNEESKTEE